MDVSKTILNDLLSGSHDLCNFAVRASFPDEFNELQLLFVWLALAGVSLSGHSRFRNGESQNLVRWVASEAVSQHDLSYPICSELGCPFHNSRRTRRLPRSRG